MKPVNVRLPLIRRPYSKANSKKMSASTGGIRISVRSKVMIHT